jgi:hypothetical protein
VCRGHILAALSDRLLPYYVRHGTARTLWKAVARTYDLAWNPVGRGAHLQSIKNSLFSGPSTVLDPLKRVINSASYRPFLASYDPSHPDGPPERFGSFFRIREPPQIPHPAPSLHYKSRSTADPLTKVEGRKFCL